MPRITLEVGLAVGGFILTFVLLVLDKAEKLEGPALYVLLALAGIMTLPLALNNRIVTAAPGAWRYWAQGVVFATVALLYTAFGIWITPMVKVTETAEIVARLYMRGLWPQPPATSGEYKPFMQEFFYDWVLTIVPEGPTGNITIVVKEPSPREDDRIKVEPDIASLSEPKPMWLSGFEEPDREPDYYERVIRFPSGLEKDRPARITFRRPIRMQLLETTFGPRDFSRSFDVTAERCRVVKISYHASDQFATLMHELEALANWRYSGSNSPPLAIRKDPDAPLPPLAPSEIETTLEARCQDATCKKVVVHQLEARVNRP